LAYIREIVIKKMSVKRWNPGAKEERKKEGTEDTKGKKSKVKKKREETQSNSK